MVETHEGAVETDPLRPYRVHELLTRHDLGKRRGRAERDGAAPVADAESAGSLPDWVPERDTDAGPDERADPDPGRPDPVRPDPLREDER